MKKSTKTGIKVAAVAAAGALAFAGLTGCAGGGSKTFTVWWYSGEDTAQYKAWTAALEEFKTLHPDITVKFEFKTWEQIEKSGNSILDSDKAPDLSEWNKGNGTAGTASNAGLLKNLNSYASKYGWDTSLPASAQAVGRYTNGLMGQGDLYGVPTYGEYVGYFVNDDLLKASGIDAATLTDDAAFTAALDKLKGAGVQPISAADYMLVHLAYNMTLNKADQDWVNSYQFFTSPVDFNDEQFTYASDTLKKWVDAGYIPASVSGATADDAVAAFTSGAAAFMPGGTWLDSTVAKAATFNWSKILAPGNKVSTGSAGNVWVIPEKGHNADLAAEFINLTLSEKYQNMMADDGGLPLLATSTPTDPTTLKTLPLFQALVADNGLGFYPDWPVSGYYDVLKASVIDLVAGNTTPAQYRDAIGKFYNDNKPAN
jgi:raffinose/stachyose/melibiose transport system substrate-binding protein